MGQSDHFQLNLDALYHRNLSGHLKIKSSSIAKPILFITISLSSWNRLLAGWLIGRKLWASFEMSVRFTWLRWKIACVCHHKHLAFSKINDYAYGSTLTLTLTHTQRSVCRFIWLQERKVIIFDPKPLGISLWRCSSIM